MKFCFAKGPWVQMLLLKVLLAGFLVSGVGPVHGAVKWHPGHYVQVNPDKLGEAAFNVVVTNDCFVGAQLIYRWRDFEVTNGVYDFSKLRHWVKFLEAKGKRTMLLLVLQDYSRNGLCVPDYLLNEASYAGGQVVLTNATGQPKRAYPKFWLPAVTDRLIALNEALAKEFDDEPFFEGFCRAEIAVPKPVGDASAYSSQAVQREAQREFAATCKAFQHTLVLIGANWITTKPDFFEQAAQTGVGGVWGPDVAMHHLDNLKALDGTWAYPFYPRYQGKIPLTISDQGAFDDSRNLKGITMDQLWNFVITDREGLYVSHMIWTGWRASFLRVQLPYIQAKKGYIANTVCPENLVKFGGGAETAPKQKPAKL